MPHASCALSYIVQRRFNSKIMNLPGFTPDLGSLCTNKGDFRRPGKNHKSLVSGGGSGGGGGRGVGGSKGEVAAVMLATLAVVLVSPLTLYRSSATVLIHFILKLIFPKNKKKLKNS